MSLVVCYKFELNVLLAGRNISTDMKLFRPLRPTILCALCTVRHSSPRPIVAPAPIHGGRCF